jgi:hypothetical protein
MLAMCTGDTGLDGLACVLGGCCLGRGVLWVGAGEGTVVGSLQREERQRGGAWARSSSSLHFSRLGSGQRGLVSTAGSSMSMATGFERARTVKLTVIKICSIFICQVLDEIPARDSNSNFLKFSTLGDQHIG